MVAMLTYMGSESFLLHDVVSITTEAMIITIENSFFI